MAGNIIRAVPGFSAGFKDFNFLLNYDMSIITVFICWSVV